MWSLVSKMGSSESKFTMNKGNYHTVSSLVGPGFIPDLNKQFSYFKSNTNLISLRNCQNYCNSSKMNQQVANSSRVMPEIETTTTVVPNNSCNNSKKKKRKRRRKKKKKNNNQQLKVECVKSKQRQRTISEDSFVIFFDEETSDNETETTEFGSSDSIVPNKKVRFPSDSQLCEVHPMIVWSYAYQAARKGPWEEYARDRCRFKKRVVNTEAQIGHVLEANHRLRIYEERFASL